jgi:myotubularin-related protein 3/4
MVVGIPSLVGIVADDDMHVCGVSIHSNTIPIDSTAASLCCTISPMQSMPLSSSVLPLDKSKNPLTNIDDLPFDFLAGEDLIEHGTDSSDGSIYLTTYRLFIFSNESCCSFINCPIRLIDSIEVKDNIYLYMQCKDIRSFRLAFSTTDKCSHWLRKLTEAINAPASLDDLFAIKFASAVPQQESSMRDHFHDELIRLQLDTYPWRSTEINKNYKLCSSYPEYCVVPSAVTDEEVAEVAKFRSYRRFPTIVWR